MQVRYQLRHSPEHVPPPTSGAGSDYTDLRRRHPRRVSAG